VDLPLRTDFRVVMPDHVVTRLVDGMTVLLDVDSGRTFSLDDIGTRAWQVLIETPTVQAAVEQLQREYEAEPGELERDVLALIDRLASAQLVQLQGRQP
jgi:Coenzyme PQQ synthesis protein D (PqqD)